MEICRRSIASFRGLGIAVIVSAAACSACMAAQDTCDPAANTEAIHTYHQAKTMQASSPQKIISMLKPAVENLGGSCPDKPALLTRVAQYEFTVSEFQAAFSDSSRALELGQKYSTISPNDAAADHFLCASYSAIRGDFERSKRAYRNALQLLNQLGPTYKSAVARVYSDLALLYIKNGYLQEAEAALEQSLSAEQAGTALEEERVLRLDAVVHLQYQRGRISDAVHSTQQLVMRYGNAASISARLRGHLYRDRGEVLLIAGDLQASEDALMKSLSLAEKNTTLPDRASDLALLARTSVARNDPDGADDRFSDALASIEPIAMNFPEDGIEIALCYGQFLAQQHRWKDAYTDLRTALAWVDHPGLNTEMVSEYFAQFAAVDHHLHNRKEEKAMKERAKSFRPQESTPPAAKDTVDILALRAER